MLLVEDAEEESFLISQVINAVFVKLDIIRIKIITWMIQLKLSSVWNVQPEILLQKFMNMDILKKCLYKYSHFVQKPMI